MGLTKQVALDYAPHMIHVNALLPSWVATSMTRIAMDNEQFRTQLKGDVPWPRFQTPEEVGKMALVMSGDAVSYMTGSVVAHDGGYLTK